MRGLRSQDRVSMASQVESADPCRSVLLLRVAYLVGRVSGQSSRDRIMVVMASRGEAKRRGSPISDVKCVWNFC